MWPSSELSADELNKMVLLIDEDISGKVTISEYYQYLAAFNMRVEPTSEEYLSADSDPSSSLDLRR